MGNALVTPGQSTDVISVDRNHPLYLQVKKAKEEMTGWERVRFVFKTNEYGEFSPEMMRIKDSVLIAFAVGAMLGGIGRSKIAYMDFFRRNVATQFETPLQAKRTLQDQVTLGLGAGAWRVGWRLSAFTFMFMTTSTVISTYRGKYGVLDQVGGAGTAGFLYKLRDGPKAAVSGTIFGSLLGLVAGLLTLGLLKLVGTDHDAAALEYYSRVAKSMDEEKEYLRKAREKDLAKGTDTYLEKDELGVAHMKLMHDKLVSQATMEDEENTEAKGTQSDKTKDKVDLKLKPKS